MTMNSASIVRLVGVLVPLCVKTTETLGDLQTKYSQSNSTISAIKSECSILTATLNQIDTIAKRNADSLTLRLDPNSSHLGPTIELALSGCSIVLSVVYGEFQKVTEEQKVSSLTRRLKVIYMWNEAGLKDLLVTVRGQQTALNLLITAMQTDSISSIRQILSDNNASLQAMVQRSQTIRQERAASDTSGRDMEFNFDDQLMSSAAYQRAFRSFMKAGETSKALDTKPTIDATIFRDLPNVSSPHGRQPEPVSDALASMKASDSPLQGRNPSINQPTISSSPGGQSESNTSTLTSLVSKSLDTYQAATSTKVEILNADTRTQIASQLPKAKMNKLLRTAAQHGHTDIIKLLLHKGADIDTTDEQEATPLFIAAQNGHFEALEAICDAVLMKNPRGLLLPNKSGDTVLHTACAHSDSLPMIDHLVSIRGLDVEQAGHSGWRPMHYAAAANNATLVEYLFLKFNADLSALDNEGNSPLHVAARKGSIDAVEILLDYHVDISLCNAKKGQAIHSAAMENQKRAVGMLLERGADIECRQEDGWTPLFCAVKSQEVETLKFLLDHGADVNANTDIGQPIHLAAAIAPGATVLILLAQPNVSVEQVGDDSSLRIRPLHEAAYTGNMSAIRALLDYGAEIDCKTPLGLRPLHLTAGAGHFLAVEFLLQSGADPTQVSNEQGWLPIHHAVLCGDVKITLLLLDAYPASLEMLCGLEPSRLTPLGLAARDDRLEVLQALAKRGADVICIRDKTLQPIHIATQSGHARIILALKDAGARMNAFNPHGLLPLIEAVKLRNLDTITALLDSGANIELFQFDQRQLMPIHYACMFDSKPLELLIARGADIEATAALKLRPLHIAAFQGTVECLKVLLQAGADTEALDSQGKTALDFAVTEGHTDIVELLI